MMLRHTLGAALCVSIAAAAVAQPVPDVSQQREAVNALMADDALMAQLNAADGPTVECMIGALAPSYRPMATSEQVKAWVPYVLAAKARCGVKAQAARTVKLIKNRFPKLSDAQAADLAEGVIFGEAWIGAALESGKSHPTK